MELLGFGNEKLPSVINDPFKKSKIIGIYTYILKSSFDENKFNISGKVKFENGNTKGEQEFEAATFDELIVKIRAMIDNM